MPQNVLITGVCGFSGRHLVSHLRGRGEFMIAGVDLPPAPPMELDFYSPCDLLDTPRLHRVLATVKPDLVFHLAGLMGQLPAEEIWRVNVGGYTSLAEALRHFGAKRGGAVRLITVGSAAELGSAGATQLPVCEDAPCEPETPYGRSKLAITRMAIAEPAASGLEVIVARPFNLVGPGLSRQLSLGNFAAQIAAVYRGEQDAVTCGPLDARRDFVDVRDAVEAYVTLAQQSDAVGVFNICAGQSHRIRDLLARMIELAGTPIKVIEIKAPRPGDLADIYGDTTKISRVGWRPRTPIEQSLRDLMNAVLNQHSARSAA